MSRASHETPMYARRVLDLSLALKRRPAPGDARGGVFTFAESCTGGLLASSVTSIPGVSEVFAGSVVAYSGRAKIERLSVAPETLEKHGSVSGQCAAEMAWGALGLFGSLMAVSVTGIAGPGGGTDEKPVGTVWFAIAHRSGRVRLKRGYYPGNSRQGVRIRSVKSALRLLLDGLEYEFAASIHRKI
ncbi:MAG: nicotinamide-nucleotide amidohydrolase family protein [Synergistaceae bacterium]|nr:nicotinamide-nucleotide amidohydrolase family protein [Synergistaceae bacterium]